MEYDHGQRITPHVWELSPLDLSIQQYDNRCKNYHYKKRKAAGETEEQRNKRLADLKEAKALLDLERRRIMCMTSVQAQLQAYRDEHKCIEDEFERVDAYASEKHHPTGVLEDNLRLAGRAQPSNRYTAHHVVEGKGKLPITADARLLLFMNDIRINDPDNGVWMPRDENDRGHWAMPKATPHSRIHTHEYERWVHGEIINLNSEQEIRGKLTIIRAHLKNGTQPERVTKT
ncbi:AHH domain-containing protein [Microbulbifer hainanensis]|uniref:AHH domain-containing protein n=1 Tax=Microbulbifer hainanensis TaxID=2735675 RepID=UPI001867096D|nr:AHH domain-containing protein [Microbulbifer hainanensis]